MTSQKLNRIEKLLKDDIRWAIRHKNLKWDPGASAGFLDGIWTPTAGSALNTTPKVCGVCAVAAHVVRHQPKFQYDYRQSDDVVTAAKSLGVDENWLGQLYYAVMDAPEYQDETADDASKLGYRLRAYAEAYTKKYKAEQKRKRAAAKAK